MFFYLSKLLWLLAAPSNLVFLFLAIGLALAFTRWRGAGRAIAAAALIVGAAIGSGPAGVALLAPLETRFAPLPVDAPAPAGIIVLGGAVGEMDTAFGPQLSLSDAAERMTEGVALARRYPQATLLFSGGSAALLGSDRTEAQAARRLWDSLGVAPERVVYESRSRNTFENAVMSRELAQPKRGERWLLVTSAHHMPRAIGIFRKAGFPVVAAPVDFRAPTGRRLPLAREWSAGLGLFDMAAHEWIGLIAYRLTGRTDALLPGP